MKSKKRLAVLQRRKTYNFSLIISLFRNLMFEELFRKNKNKMPAPNKQFGAMAGVVIIRAVVFRTTVSGSLNGVQLSRHFAKPRGVVCWLSFGLQFFVYDMYYFICSYNRFFFSKFKFCPIMQFTFKIFW